MFRSILTLFSIATAANAALLTFTDYATWAAAVGQPINTVTFSATTPGSYGAGLSEGGVLFEGISAGPWDNYLWTVSVGYCAATGCIVGPPTEAGALGATDGYLRATLPFPVTAVAMEVGAYHSAGDIPEFRFSNGDTYTGPADPGGATFYGFISTTAFTYVDYHVSVGASNGDFTVMDTFYYPAPEPSPALLLPGALAGLLVLKRRRATSRTYGR